MRNKNCNLASLFLPSVVLAGALALALPACGGNDADPSSGDGDGDNPSGSGGGPDQMESGGSSPGGADSSGGSKGDGGAGGDGNVTPKLESLEISPDTVELSAIDGAEPEQEFTVTATFSDGSEANVTNEAALKLNDSSLGSIVGDKFVSNGRKGGEGVITATLAGKTTTATVVVDVTIIHLFEPATTETPGIFVGATPEDSLTPALVYPEPDSIAPPNLAELDVHFTDPTAESDVFEVSVERPYFHLLAYLEDTKKSTHFATLGEDLWDLIRENGEGSSVELGVRGLNSEDTSQVGVSLSQTLSIASGPSEGRIYFRSEGTGMNAGIYRYLMDDGEAEAEPIYIQQNEPQQRCISCHSLSADGGMLAATLNGGGGIGTVVNTETGAAIVPAALSWNFAAFDPGADEMLTVSDGVFTLRSALNGSAITTVTSVGQVTHPSFNTEGSALTYVRKGTLVQDWLFEKGSILTRSYSRDDNEFGEEEMLVETTGAENNYYPTFSPDSEFVLFTRSTGTAMMAPTSDLYVVDAAGDNDPIPLDLANKEGDITNSHGVWSFSSSTLGSGSDEEPVLWLAFASKRSFGVRLAAEDKLQLWIAPFFPERARNGDDPSGPALRLPLQDITFNNYMPTWIE